MNSPLMSLTPWMFTRPPGTRPPMALALLEGRALLEGLSLPLAWPCLRASLPPGDGHPVMVLPGLMAGDASTWPLRQFLQQLGYDARGWGLGINTGPRAHVRPRLNERLQQLHAESGRRVSLIGWSLGGVFARELARDQPELSRQVISLGSPLYGTPGQAANPWVWHLFKALNPELSEAQADEVRGHRPPPVPCTSIYTRTDSVVGWGASVEYSSPLTDNVEVNSASHLGLGINPLVWYVIGDRLAQAEGQWAHFKPAGLRRFLFRGKSPAQPLPPQTEP
ncbi:alpha/beta hydrolase [Curvibacter sp. HBC61]|uniref:Alpha/beta hydrolase n=1 Tax=Curvibacter cyanobacteriorum TaxID=3026422 RepID=A0ABT5N6G2_9BURK|nr:alpha/beta hydrolase [Curvibacter sp. HBC61]MDD0841071.1 alpha/beta hydrolase [Curvibacter sp. HBC61]